MGILVRCLFAILDGIQALRLVHNRRERAELAAIQAHVDAIFDHWSRYRPPGSDGRLTL